MNARHRIATLLILLCAAPVFGNGDEAPTIIHLVRHAEKTEAAESVDPRNPHLSEAGLARAAELVRTLGETKIDAIYSTNYFRTMETVEPLAERLGVEIDAYDPGDLRGFAEQLIERGGRILVSGHSNTTPALVELLGGDPGDPIDEPTEYDRLYILFIDESGTSTVMLRYGASSSEGK